MTQQTLSINGWVTTDGEDEEIFLEILVLHQPSSSIIPLAGSQQEATLQHCTDCGAVAWSEIEPILSEYRLYCHRNTNWK